MAPPIVIGAHPSRHESEPMELGAMLARLTGAPLEVIGTYWFDSTKGRTAEQEHAETLRHEVQAALDRVVAHSEIELGQVEVRAMSGSAATVLDEHAERIGAALIVVGATHKGLFGRALGSTTERILRRGTRPVAVAPRGFTDSGERVAAVGVAFSDTPDGHSALQAAAAIARRTGAQLSVATFTEESKGGGERLEQSLKQAAGEQAPGLDVRTVLLTRGGAEGLVDLTRELDVLVTGARIQGPLRLVRRLARESACPLIVVPRGLDARIRELFASTVSGPAGGEKAG